MKAKKPQRFSTICSIFNILVIIAAIIVYVVASNKAGYFKDTLVTSYVGMEIAAAACLLLTVIIAQFFVKGNAATQALNLLTAILKLVAVALLMYTVVNMAANYVEGLAYLFFSDQNVLDVLQTPENMNSAYMIIASIGVAAVAWVLVLLSCFFGYKARKVVVGGIESTPVEEIAESVEEA
jgi:hypothetical protein